MVNDIQYGKNFSNETYDRAQKYLSDQIKQPKSLADLKRNANLKFRQVQLARAQGDLELAAILAYEHQRIIQDINNYYN